MKEKLLFDFQVDKDNSVITIKREFAAERRLVWDAYTKSELLDQWFAPKPLTTKTKSMDFREGGHWHYAMVEPEGTEYWSRLDYIKIHPIDHYSALDGFSNEKGELNEQLPRATWDVRFLDHEKNSLVETVVTYSSLEDLQTVLEMGMQEGMTSTLERLDELIEKLTKKMEKITVQASIDAAPEKVWDYYTKPKHITNWNFAADDWHCPKAENELKPGGKYSARMEAKDGSFGFDFEAVYDEVVPQKSFTYTMLDGRVVTTKFEAVDNKTNLTITFDPETQNPLDLQREGWQAILNNFKKYAESH